jgi:beta-N-acetylhexosaminidase
VAGTGVPPLPPDAPKIAPMGANLTGRGRLAIAALAGVAAGSLVLGIALGRAPAGDPTVASRLTIPQLAGQRFVFGFNGTSVPRPVARMIREGGAAGVVLFAGNFPTRAAGRRLIRRLQRIPRPAHLRDPLLVMTDQEGGLVKRLSGAPNASAEGMGARGAAYSRKQGRLTARNLEDVGVNVDLAPVLDVARPGGVIADTDRGFGSTAARVAATAVPFADALQGGGAAATAKHFPGLGAARENTDFAVQRIDLPKRRLRAVDERPYQGFVSIGGSLVMVSSAIYPAFSDKPASLTRSIAVGELRGRLGFRGVSATDALGSAAVKAAGGPTRAAVAAAKAGTDLLLFSDYQTAARAQAALRKKLREGRIDRGRAEVSVQRVLTLRHRLRTGTLP